MFSLNQNCGSWCLGLYFKTLAKFLIVLIYVQIIFPSEIEYRWVEIYFTHKCGEGDEEHRNLVIS